MALPFGRACEESRRQLGTEVSGGVLGGAEPPEWKKEPVESAGWRRRAEGRSSGVDGAIGSVESGGDNGGAGSWRRRRLAAVAGASRGGDLAGAGRARVEATSKRRRRPLAAPEEEKSRGWRRRTGVEGLGGAGGD